MKKNLRLLALLLISVLASGHLASAAEKIRVLIITGGHDFERQPFFQLFEKNPDITWRATEPASAPALFKPEPAKQYDVILLYDFNQKLSEEGKADFVARLKGGKGLVVLHHAIAAYPDWPEYWKIIGAHYYLAKTNINGVAKARSAFKHGMHFTIHIADPKHPIMRGVKDYAMHDETYKWFDVAPECHPLLTTTEPESNPVIAWTKTYGGARVFYMQSGHDHFAYDNPNFQRILRQAIRWSAARKD